MNAICLGFEGSFQLAHCREAHVVSANGFMGARDLAVMVGVRGRLGMASGEGHCPCYSPVLLVAWEEGHVSPLKALKSAVDTKLGVLMV